MSKLKENTLSTSLLSVRRKTKKTHEAPPQQEELLMKLGQAQVLSGSSPSPLAEVYNTEQFRNEWANEVKFHVARNILHLRRYRKLTQSRVGKAMKTSQSAIARIESERENITLDTLRRLIIVLKGRLHISIPPQELSFQREPSPWWEVTNIAHTENPWRFSGYMAVRGTQSERMIIGLERRYISAGPFLLEGKTS